jgi:hypothetical protein
MLLIVGVGTWLVTRPGSSAKHPLRAAAPAAASSESVPPAATRAALPAPAPAAAGPPSFFAASTVSKRAAVGNRLTLVAVRTGTHDGYDRVVLEFGGTGTVGWRIGYDAQPRRQGSGDPVAVDGTATLSILAQGVGYPQDTGVTEYSGPRQLTPSLPSVRALQIGGVFEGQLDAFVGVNGQHPFQVLRLSGPERLVIDIAHRG